jgi:sulfur relay (sulfurtransferase) DsrF/TusC family protein
MIELEEHKQSSQNHERAYKEQVIISRKAKYETTQRYREQRRLLNTKLEDAQRLIQAHEKRDEENQRTILETKGMFNLIKLYTWCVSFQKILRDK